MSSDEDELPEPMKEKAVAKSSAVEKPVLPKLFAASQMIKSPAVSSERGSDDDVLLISCKPYISKSNKGKNQHDIKSTSKLADVKPDRDQAAILPRRNKARKRAPSKSIGKNTSSPRVKELRLGSQIDKLGMSEASRLLSDYTKEGKNDIIKDCDHPVSKLLHFLLKLLLFTNCC